MKLMTELQNLLKEYDDLYSKLIQADTQNQYFFWARASKIRKLESLQKNYELLKLEYNKHNINSLKKEIERLYKETEKIEQLNNSFSKSVKRFRIQHKIDRFNSFIEMKERGIILPAIAAM